MSDNSIIINLPIENHEVPELRQCVGWERRDHDYPALFERCNFWAGLRDEKGALIAFGYVAGMGLQHGYMEDILVHPEHQKQGIGDSLVKKLLEEVSKKGLEIVTLTFAPHHARFYEKCGFHPCGGGVWRKEN